MARNISDCPEYPNIKNHVEKLKISFISPLFGGGTQKGLWAVRETSIRGQLRFWWRATKGAQFNSIKEMRKREAEIFGNTEKASNVIIKVKNLPIPRNSEFKSFPDKLDRNNRIIYNQRTRKPNKDYKYSYVLFPFRETQQEPQIDGVQNIEFELEIRILEQENIEQDIHTALKAWLNFGGLGARTRRACGSLYCEKYSFENQQELSNFIKDNSKTSSNFPTLNSIFYKEINSYSVSNFNEVVNYLKSFRQDISVGRNAPTKKFDGTIKPAGRSRWPEADTIRQKFIKDCKINDHKKRLVQENCVPRAEFGLPIMIDFNNKLEPKAKELIPADYDKVTRFASPLIMRTLKLKNNKYAHIIVLLNGKLPKKVKINNTDINFNVSWTPTNLRDNFLIEDGSALKGFINHITTKKGFKKLSNGGAN